MPDRDPTTRSPLPGRHGFSLIDASLGIIAGIGLMAGSILAFQHASSSRDISEIARMTVTLSFDLRNASRRLERFSDMTGTTQGDLLQIDLNGYLDAASSSYQLTAFAPMSGPDTFEIHIGALPRSGCRRLSREPAILNQNAVIARCVAEDEDESSNRLEVIFGR